MEKKIKNRKKLVIFISIGFVSLAALTTGLVFVFKNKDSKKNKDTNLNIQKFSESNKQQSQKELDDEQDWVNKIKIDNKINPLKSGYSNQKGEFNYEIAKTYGIEFETFDTDTFIYHYSTSEDGIKITAKFKNNDFKDLVSNKISKNIVVNWMEDKYYNDKIAALNEEQKKVNNLESDKNKVLLKPDNDFVKEVFTKEVAAIYKIPYDDFNIEDFLYYYSTYEDGIEILVRIKDNNLSSIKPSELPKKIVINWKTKEEIEKIDQDQKELNEEQQRINDIIVNKESSLYKPLDKDFISISEKEEFNNDVATKYGIDFKNFDIEKFEYKYYSLDDSSIVINPKIINRKSIISELASKPIKIKWKEWKRGWYTKIQKDFPMNFTSNKTFNEIDNRLKKTNYGSGTSSSSRNVIDLFEAENSIVELPNIHGVKYSIIMPHEIKSNDKKVRYIALIINSKNLRGVLQFWIQYK